MENVIWLLLVGSVLLLMIMFAMYNHVQDKKYHYYSVYILKQKIGSEDKIVQKGPDNVRKNKKTGEFQVNEGSKWKKMSPKFSDNLQNLIITERPYVFSLERDEQLSEP